MAAESVDISQLTDSQQEALQSYISFTDQDPIAAIPILQRAEWNTQIAITRFFDGEPTSDPLAEAASAIPPVAARQTTNLQYESLLAATRPQPIHTSSDTVQRVDITSSTIPQYRPGVLLSILFTPFKILYGVLSTVLSPFSFLLPGFVNRVFANLLAAPRPNRRPLPPGETAHRFIREFNEEHPSSTPLPWAETGFNLSLDTARSKQKFLLAILISPSHDDSSSYVRETLQSTTFTSFVQSNSSDIILWGGNVQDAEAYQVSTNLNCTKFPFTALICQTPSTSSSSASTGNMTVVSRLTGPMPVSEFVAKLGTAMTSHQAALRTARAAQAEQQASRNLRQEQDSAYERSLAQDRERAKKAREEEEARSNAEREARRKATEVETQLKKRQQWRRWKSKSIPRESGTEVKDAIRVSLRMSDGQRTIRRFRPDQNVSELYEFVECFDLLDPSSPSAAADVTQVDETLDTEPTDYTHEYKFRLVSPMPRTVYEANQPGTIGGRIGKGANLIVEPIEDEDDEDENENEKEEM